MCIRDRITSDEGDLSLVKNTDDTITESANVDVVIQSIEFDPNRPWHEIVPQLHLGGRANELIKHCLLKQHTNGIISLELKKDREDLYADTTKQEIQSALMQLFGSHIKLELTIALDNTIPVKSDANNRLETPAQRSARKETELQQQAISNIENDPFVNELKNRFGAQLVPGSVQPKTQ